ncbi:MAG: hypothetical protein RIR90_20, partial [Bacteroidota bacterium]
LQILGTTMGTPDEFAAMVHLFEQYKIQPVIDGVYSMDQAEQAIRKMDTAGQFGKIVLQIAD